MKKLFVLQSGNDWADASYVVMKKLAEFDTDEQYDLYRNWYEEAYCPALNSGWRIPYRTFEGWLVDAGLAETVVLPTFHEV